MSQEPLFGYSDMIKQPDGSYRYVRGDIGTSPMGQAKLVLRRYEDMSIDEKTSEVIFLQNILRSVLEESDRRLFASLPWFDRMMRRLFR